MTPATPYADLPTLAAHLRAVLDPAGTNKKCVLLYAYNGTGKTRLSMAFKDAVRRILDNLRDQYTFNPELFEQPQQAATL
jgi:hypothetical protein